ncbi:MAG: triose-phosphate isomerase [Gemmatimonadota bacterium]
MIKRPFFAANWKMHHGPADAAAFVAKFASIYAPRADRTVVLFPPAVSVAALREALADRTDVGIGVQDVHEEASGAHTGSLSAGMVAQAGAGWVLAGHSERRHEFGDTDDQVAEKVNRVLEVDLRPILCVGETLEERVAGRLEAVLRRQLKAVLTTLAHSDAGALTYAYEPVWAIGTGRTASPEDAAEAHAILRGVIEETVNAASAAEATVLYGGSVKPSNIGELLAAEGVDGGLVGGASLDPESFAAICSAGAEET